jgi:hypothetical protein
MNTLIALKGSIAKGRVCRNPSLGMRPKQGVARSHAKRKTRESHHMLPGVQRVWGNEPSHSQVNSNVGSWSPKWTPASSERDCRGQKSLPWRVLYIIGKLLKLKCLNWACIAHLDIWNTSYAQKKGRESNYQFDSRPLKVGNRPNFLACRQLATYRWKALDEGYNFALDLITIGGLNKKLCALKVVGVSSMGILGLPLWVGFVQVHVSDWSLLVLPSPILELQHAPPPLYSVASQGVCPDSLPFRYFQFGTPIWVSQGVGNVSECIKFPQSTRTQWRWPK